jgi:cellobiose phosphorylase
MASHPTWTFLDNDGTFRLLSPEKTSSLYFPLVNEAGMMSCVTPILHGDIKTGQHTFLTRPLSVEDLHESRATRNIWVDIGGFEPWSANGVSAPQIAARYQENQPEESSIEAGFLWHRLTREHPESGLKAEITNLVPASEDKVEVLRVALTNSGSEPLQLSVLFAVPIFGRSADNLRDHRHVTSLLNQIEVLPHGVVVQPTLVFDENGHHPNQTRYAVLGADQDGSPPAVIFPILEEFIGQGGTLDWPEAVVKNLPSSYQPGQTLNGLEALGGMRFSKITLNPDDTVSYIFIMGIDDQPGMTKEWIKEYGSANQFEHWMAKSSQYWKDRLDPVRIDSGNKRRDCWVRWVSAQPIFRDLFGNSFLPYHDYGRGGRGWRDLWQDILGLLLMQREDVSQLLEGHFAGIRFDGSNATIIGHEPGEFKADRNDIPRVWMDHGAWPLFTTKMYLDWTGDLGFLLREQPYFKDHLTHRSQGLDKTWSDKDGTVLKTSAGEIYLGSVFEHLLIQNLVPFFNVGGHNCTRLEGADWNDALDMAPQQGESVAFTAFYAGNLTSLAHLADQLAAAGNQEISLASELGTLLDSLFDPINYDDPTAKIERLNLYLDSCASEISGQEIKVDLAYLASDLRKKSQWVKAHLQRQEWIEVEDHGWFNGYYDDQGRRVEGVFEDTVQMTLTGQVFQLLCGVATNEQALKIADSVQRYLFDPALNGVRLNSEFKYNTDSLGRVFGFAFGHKENGAMFSHMAVMYAYALFERNLTQEGHQLLEDLYQHCQNFPVSRMYPGIPEYLDPAGRGLYPYLTGSASWYMLTLITKIFGIRGVNGDLFLKPALPPAWFDEEGKATVQIPFAGRMLRIVFHRSQATDSGKLSPQEVKWNGKKLLVFQSEEGLGIKREELLALPDQGWQQLDVTLA